MLHHREGRRAVAVPGYPLTPACFVLGTLVLAGIAGVNNPVELTTALLTLLTGSVIYLVLKKYRP